MRCVAVAVQRRCVKTGVQARMRARFTPGAQVLRGAVRLYQFNQRFVKYLRAHTRTHRHTRSQALALSRREHGRAV